MRPHKVIAPRWRIYAAGASALIISIALTACGLAQMTTEDVWNRYWGGGVQKALAQCSNGVVGAAWGSQTQEVAKRLALQQAYSNSGVDCRIVNLNGRAVQRSQANDASRSTPVTVAQSYVLRLDEKSKLEVLKKYFSGSPYRALVYGSPEIYVAVWQARSLKAASRSALDLCQSQSGENCRVIDDQTARSDRLSLESPSASPNADRPSTQADNPELNLPPRTAPSILVRRVQGLLSELGYAVGPADGIAGSQTVSAVRQFQSDAGLEPTGQITQELELLLGIALEIKEGEGTNTKPKSFGSGTLINAKGHVLTNSHVIEDCSYIVGNFEGSLLDLSVIATDPNADLAILKGDFDSNRFAKFATEKIAALGQEVTAAGFPLKGLLGGDLTVTYGEISSLSGMGNDARFYQISAPVQPGNSGGPLLDQEGMLVGVVTAKLDAAKAFELTGDIPQNVNFAIKVSLAKSLMDIHGIAYAEPIRSGGDRSKTELASIAKTFTLEIVCY